MTHRDDFRAVTIPPKFKTKKFAKKMRAAVQRPVLHGCGKPMAVCDRDGCEPHDLATIQANAHGIGQVSALRDLVEEICDRLLAMGEPSPLAKHQPHEFVLSSHGGCGWKPPGATQFSRDRCGRPRASKVHGIIVKRSGPPCGDGMHCTCSPGAHERMRPTPTDNRTKER